MGLPALTCRLGEEGKVWSGLALCGTWVQNGMRESAGLMLNLEPGPMLNLKAAMIWYRMHRKAAGKGEGSSEASGESH